MSASKLFRNFANGVIHLPVTKQGLFLNKRCLISNDHFFRFVSKSTSSRHETAQFEIEPEALPSVGPSLRERIGTSARVPTRDELLYDFKYTLVTKLDESKIKERFAAMTEDQRPLVVLAGWAGSTPKNLSKYSELYHRAGCYTLGYNLPSRFVFTETSEVPHVARELLKAIEEKNLMDRPIFFHLMSDTGLMVFQGLDLVLKQQQKHFNVKGAVLDSCPGPRPKMTIPRGLALAVVNWICCRKDGQSFLGCLKETYRLISIRLAPSAIRALYGLPLELSLMNHTWSGDYYRDLPAKLWPELILYSKTDFYLPWQYLENEVLDKMKKAGRDVRTKRWNRSPHVAHLRAHKEEYEKAVHDFVYDTYVKPTLHRK